jgi:hypothetical protein
MSALNPYEGFLDGRPIQTILATTRGSLAKVLSAIGPDKLDTAPTPANGVLPRSSATWPTARLPSVFVSARHWPKMRPHSSPSTRKSGPRPMAESLPPVRLKHSPACAGGICDSSTQLYPLPQPGLPSIPSAAP